MYFNKLGTTKYGDITIPDILKRIVIHSPNLLTSNLFEQYEIKEEETPEIISFKYYGTVDYYWTILVLNNIKSRYFDWPLTSQNFGSYIQEKYDTKSALFLSEVKLSNFVLCKTKYIQKTISSTGEKINYDVLFCDRNLNKLEIKKTTPSIILANDTILDFFDKDHNLLMKTTVDRVVYENSQAVHHFDYNLNQSSDRLVYNDKNTLDQYISGNTPLNTVSNIEYELKINDNKRVISLLKPEHIDTFVTQFKIIAETN
jgi:hypothetical protein